MHGIISCVSWHLVRVVFSSVSGRNAARILDRDALNDQSNLVLPDHVAQHGVDESNVPSPSGSTIPPRLSAALCQEESTGCGCRE